MNRCSIFVYRSLVYSCEETLDMHLLTCGYCYYFSHYTRLCIFILSASHWCYFWLSDHDPDTEAINDRLTMRYNSSIHNDYCSSSLFQHLGLCVQTHSITGAENLNTPPSSPFAVNLFFLIS